MLLYFLIHHEDIVKNVKNYAISFDFYLTYRIFSSYCGKLWLEKPKFSLLSEVVSKCLENSSYFFNFGRLRELSHDEIKTTERRTRALDWKSLELILILISYSSRYVAFLSMLTSRPGDLEVAKEKNCYTNSVINPKIYILKIRSTYCREKNLTRSP